MRLFVTGPVVSGWVVAPVREAHMMYVGGETGYTDYPVLAAVLRHRGETPAPAGP